MFKGTKNERSIQDALVIWGFHTYNGLKEYEGVKYLDSFMNIAAMYGFYRLTCTTLSTAYRLLTRFSRSLFQSSNRLYQQYSQKIKVSYVSNGKETMKNIPYQTWALVTQYDNSSFSDAICENLAKQGFNIILISKEDGDGESYIQKLQEKIDLWSLNGLNWREKHLYEEYVSSDGDFDPPRFQSKCIQLNFEQELPIQSLLEEIKNLDIGIAVINAQNNKLAPLKDLKDDEIQEILDVNLIHPVMMSKFIISVFEERRIQKATESEDDQIDNSQIIQQPDKIDPNVRSGLMLVTSSLSAFPAAGSLTQSSATRFVSMLGQGLNYELKHKNIDVMSYEAGEVTQEESPKQISLFGEISGIQRSIIAWPIGSQDAKTCVSRSFQDFGLQAMSRGPLLQSIHSYIAVHLPLRFVQIVLYSASLNNITRIRARQESLKYLQASRIQ